MTNEDVERIIRITWGGTIKQLRLKQDLRQTEFAQLFDPPVSQSTVARWERGAAEPSIRHKLEMGRIFGMPTGVLFPLMDAAA